MPQTISSTDVITALYEASEITVTRRSVGHAEDILVSKSEIARMIDITAPRCAELFLAAGVEVVGNKGQTKLHWMGESLSRLTRHYAPAKLRKGERKKKHSEIENEKVTAIEARRIRVLDLKIAKEEKDWIPVHVATFAISRFMEEVRTNFTSCVPLLKQKHGEDIAVPIYEAINKHLTEVFNKVCELNFNFDDADTFEYENEDT